MFIQTEETPNPLTLKFLPGRSVLGAGTADFTSPDDAASRSPLAATLFDIDGVGAVFLGPDFITVTKRAEADWPVMKPAILGAIMEHFTANRPVVNTHTDNSSQASEDDDPVVSHPGLTALVFEHSSLFSAMRSLFNDFWKRARPL